MRRILTIILLLFSVNLFGQQFADSIRVYFPVGKSAWNPEFRDNGERMREFIERIQQKESADSIYRVLSVRYVAGASPEGGTNLNSTLSQNRANSITSYLHHHINFADSIVVVNSIGEDWAGLQRLVGESDLVQKEKILEIVADDTITGAEKKRRLQAIDGSRSWNIMLRDLFPKLRGVNVIVIIGIEEPELSDILLAEEEEIFVEDEPFTPSALPLVEHHPMPGWTRQLTIKTNTIGWLMAIQNIAIEIDLSERWAFSLPFYYSGGFNYFKETIKFRTVTFQPEIKYYIIKDCGLYVGAHFGLGWYNYALDDDYRIQDKDGDTPSYGGGIGVGYTHRFKRHPRWGMEFAIGGGVYKSCYDKFYNEANGPYAERGIEKTFIGIDNASVSFTYSFDLKKRGRRR